MNNCPPPSTNAVERCGQIAKIAASLAFSANAYLECMAAESRARPVIGGFFVTFDGSLVHVNKPYHPCTCHACQMQMLLSNMFNGREPGEPSAAHVETDKWVAMVVRGGHGIKNFHGAEPGDSYLLDADGLADVPDVDKQNPTVAQVQVGIAGLSLRRRAIVHTDAAGVLQWK